MKKTLSMLLVALMVLACMPIMASAESAPVVMNWFSLNGTYSNTQNGEATMDAIQAKILEDTGLNVEINIISSDSFDGSMIALKISNGELDLISQNVLDWNALIEKGMFLELDDLLAEYGANIYEVIDSKLWDVFKQPGADGEPATYLIPVQAPVPYYCSTWMRKDLLDKYGLEIPQTTIELMDAVRVIKAGEPDMVGFTAGHISWFFNSGAFQYHPVKEDGSMTKRNADGTAMANYWGTSTGQNFWFDDPNMVAYLENMQTWYADGLIDPELFTTTFDHADSLLAQGRVIAFGNAPGWRFQDHPEEVWINLSHLTNGFNEGGTTWVYSYEVGMHIAIVATSKVAAECIQVLDWCCASEENYLLGQYGVEGTDWNYVTDDAGNTYIERVKAADGSNVFGGGPVGVIQNIRADFQASLSKPCPNPDYDFEDKKRYNLDQNKLWFSEDSWVNYPIFDSMIGADLSTVADEMFVNIVTGAIGAEEGLNQCWEMLQQAGYQEWYNFINPLYCEAMGIGA